MPVDTSVALAEFNIEIPASDILLPTTPGSWVETLKKSMQDKGTIFINMRSVGGTDVLMTFGPDPDETEGAFALRIRFATLDQLRRVIGFIHTDATKAIKAYQTAPQ